MNLPNNFKQRIEEQLSNAAPEFLAAFDLPVSTSILHNKWKGVSKLVGDKIDWNKRGELLAERPSFTLDPLLHGGSYYVQESSSMVIGYLLEQLFSDNKALKVLDLCAAPGGKSLNALNFLEGQGMLVSNEIIQSRNAVLRENITKWGYANAIVTQADPQDFAALGGFFDAILVDAPCSGEGMFRRDDIARQEWSLDNVKLCAARQTRILEEAQHALKEGGFLIYSTCTFAPQENEFQVQRLIDSGDFEVVLPQKPSEKIDDVNNLGWRFAPYKTPGEGLFVSVLKKIKEADPLRKNHKKDRSINLQPAVKLNAELAHFLGDENLPVYEAPNNLCYGWKNGFEQEIHALFQSLKVTQFGVPLGEAKGKNFIPHHALALNELLSESVAKCELDRDAALEYLRRNAVHAKGKGWALATYQNSNLGWLKLLPNRANNYYPTNWRIKTK